MSFGKFQKKEIIDLISCSWSPYWGGSGTGTPGGPNFSVQFNSASLFSGSANFTFNPNNNVVSISGSLIVSASSGTPAQFVIPESNYVYFWDKIRGSTNNIRLLAKSFSQGRIEGLNYGTATTAAGGFGIGGRSSDLILFTDGVSYPIHLRPGQEWLGGGNVLLSGSLYVSRSVFLQGLITSSTVSNVLTFNPTTGQVFYTASSALGSGGGAGSAISIYDGNTPVLVTTNLNTLYVTGSGVTMTSPAGGIVTMSFTDSNNIFGTDQYLARFSGSNAVEIGSVYNYRYLKTLLAGKDITSLTTDVSSSALFGSASIAVRSSYAIPGVGQLPENVHTFGRGIVSVQADTSFAANLGTSNVGADDFVQNLLSSTAPRVHFSCYDNSGPYLYAPFSGDLLAITKEGRIGRLLIAAFDDQGQLQSISSVEGSYTTPSNVTSNPPLIFDTNFIDYDGNTNYSGLNIQFTSERVLYGVPLQNTTNSNIICFFLEGGIEGFYNTFANHAQNIGTSAHGYGTHAEGYYSQARGFYSHAQNYESIAAGTGSSSSGFKSAAAGYYSNANNVFTSAGPTIIIDQVYVKRSSNTNDFYYDWDTDSVAAGNSQYNTNITYFDETVVGTLFNTYGYNSREGLKCIVQIPALNYIGIVDLMAKDFGSSTYKLITLLDILPTGVSITVGRVDVYITPVETGTFLETRLNDVEGTGPGYGAFTTGIETVATNSGSFAGGIKARNYGSGSFVYGFNITNASRGPSFLFGINSRTNIEKSFEVSFDDNHNLFVSGNFVGINTITPPSQSFRGLRVVNDIWVDQDVTIGRNLLVSGSSYLGNDLTDVTIVSGSLLINNFSRTTGTAHVTGSLIVSNSLNVIGTSNVTGSNNITGSWQLIGTGKVTGSLTVSSSLTTIGTSTTTGSVFITGSSTLIGNQTITGSILMTGSAAISLVNHIDFFTGSIHPHLVGRVHWDNDYGTLNIDLNSTTGNEVMSKVSQDQFYYIKNQTGATLTKGKVIRAAGTLGSSGRILGDYMIADGTIPYYYTIGIAAENIGNGQDGYVYEFGLLRGIQTDGANYGETWTDGTILYVSSTNSGGLTSVEPTAPNPKIQIAIVIKADASNGSIFIRPDLRSNINDLHNVKITAPSASGDLLVYSSSVWINSKQLTGSYGLTGSLTFLNGGITGSLFGTASWAYSASYAFTASFVTGSIFTNLNPALSASYALTSSYTLFASTANSTLFALTEGAGISDFSFDGSSATTIAVSGAASLTANRLTLWTGAAFATSSIEQNTGYLLVRDSLYVSGSFRVNGDGVTITDPAFQVDPVSGVTSIGTYQGTPVAQPGGIYFDGTDWYFGI